jgi:hypothetical protein
MLIGRYARYRHLAIDQHDIVLKSCGLVVLLDIAMNGDDVAGFED